MLRRILLALVLLLTSGPALAESGPFGLEEARRFAASNTRVATQVGNAWVAAFEAGLAVQTDLWSSWFGVLGGKKTVAEHLGYVGERTISAMKYDRLVPTYGKELFGSARFKGERVLAEDEAFRLTYIPPKEGAPQRAALFHVGGFIPYGDKVFRFLPEQNLFNPLLERGMPVYAMELKASPARLPGLGQFNLERMIDSIDRLSGIAFRHNQQQKMVLEGYCGNGLPALTFAAAKPAAADQRFSVAATMVAPIDGTQCKVMSAMVQDTPRTVRAVNHATAVAIGSQVPGLAAAMGFDLSAEDGGFGKTPAGRMTAGWKAPEWAAVRSIADLTPQQRKTLAGAYWISPEAAMECPLPLGMADFSERVFTEGLPGGKIPATYQGRPLSLKTIAEKTHLRVLGFYGGKDNVVSEATAAPLREALGRRYSHFVYPDAGHIAFVLSGKTWKQEGNPADRILRVHRHAELREARRAERALPRERAAR